MAPNKSLNLQQPQCSYSSRNSSCTIRNKKNLTTQTQTLKSCRNSEFMKPGNSERRMAIVEYHNKSVVTIAFKGKSKNYTESKCNKRINLTIFLVNTSFCVLTMPIVILQIIESNRSNENQRFGNNAYKNKIEILKSIFELFQYLNHSINFIVYCLSAETFREEIFIILSNIKKVLHRIIRI